MANEGRTEKMAKNSAASALFQIVNSLCGLVTPRIMLLAYGSAVNGLVSSITQALVFLSVVESGLAQAAQVSLYKPLAEHDYRKVSSAVSAARAAYNQVGWIFTLLTVALAFLYPVFTGTEELSYITVTALVFVLAMNYVLSFFVVSKYQVLFQADQKTYVISIAKTVARVVSAVCIVLLASPKVPILLLRIIVSSSVIIQALIITLYAKKNYKNIDYYAKPDKSALGQRWDALYMQLLGVVTGASPALLLTAVASLSHVSIYAVYNMVFSALMGVLGIFINGINASFGELLQTKDDVKKQSVYGEFENIYYWLLSIVYTTAAVMIVPFVKLYTHNVTDANYLLPGLGILFTIKALMYNIKTPQGMMVQAAGMFKETRHQNTIQALIMLIGGIVLGHFFGIYGILIACILSDGYRFLVLLFFIPKHVTKGSALPTIWRVVRMLVCGVTLYVVLGKIISLIAISNFAIWFAVAAVAGIIIVAVFSLANLLFEKEAFLSVFKRVKTLISRR